MMNMDEIVAALGGTSGAAKIFGVTMPAVSNWKADGRFPRSRRYEAFQILTKHRLKADPAVFSDPPVKSGLRRGVA